MKKQWFFSAGMCLLMVGCTQHTMGPAQQNSADATPDPALDSPGFAPIEDFSPAGELEFLYAGSMTDGYSNGNGFYRMVPRADGANNLCYIDFATQQEIYLCSQPNCAHDTDSCTSWFPTSTGMHRPIPVGDSLLVVHGGAPSLYQDLGDQALPHIDQMELDGSALEQVCQFDASFSIAPLVEDSMARDDRNLYFTLEEYREDDTIRWLCAYDVEQKKVFCLSELEEVDEKIVGCSDGLIVLSYVTEEYSYETSVLDLTCQILTYDVNSGQVNPVTTQQYVDTGVCWNSCYWVMDNAATLRSYDLQSGEMRSEASLEFLDALNLNEIQFDGLFEGKILIHSFVYDIETDHTELYYYAVDLSDGRAFPLAHVYQSIYGYDMPAIPCAESNGSLLYISDAEQKTVHIPLPGGQTMESEYEVYLFSVMPATAYWNNESASTQIEERLT